MLFIGYRLRHFKIGGLYYERPCFAHFLRYRNCYNACDCMLPCEVKKKKSMLTSFPSVDVSALSTRSGTEKKQFDITRQVMTAQTKENFILLEKFFSSFLTEVLHHTMISSEIHLFTVVLNKLSDHN